MFVRHMFSAKVPRRMSRLFLAKLIAHHRGTKPVFASKIHSHAHGAGHHQGPSRRHGGLHGAPPASMAATAAAPPPPPPLALRDWAAQRGPHLGGARRTLAYRAGPLPPAPSGEHARPPSFAAGPLCGWPLGGSRGRGTLHSEGYVRDGSSPLEAAQACAAETPAETHQHRRRGPTSPADPLYRYARLGRPRSAPELGRRSKYTFMGRKATHEAGAAARGDEDSAWAAWTPRDHHGRFDRSAWMGGWDARWPAWGSEGERRGLLGFLQVDGEATATERPARGGASRHARRGEVRGAHERGRTRERDARERGRGRERGPEPGRDRGRDRELERERGDRRRDHEQWWASLAEYVSGGNGTAPSQAGGATTTRTESAVARRFAQEAGATRAGPSPKPSALAGDERARGGFDAVGERRSVRFADEAPLDGPSRASEPPAVDAAAEDPVEAPTSRASSSGRTARRLLRRAQRRDAERANARLALLRYAETAGAAAGAAAAGGRATATSAAELDALRRFAGLA